MPWSRCSVAPVIVVVLVQSILRYDIPFKCTKAASVIVDWSQAHMLSELIPRREEKATSEIAS